MAMLEGMVSSGLVTLIALGAIALEIAVLFIYARLRGLDVAAMLFANALSGACLILALRASLLDSGAKAIALFLGLGFLAHLVDIGIRLTKRN